MAVKNGTTIVLKIGDVLVVGETQSSLNLTRDMIETTSKHSTGQAKTYIAGEKGATISASGLYDPDDATYGYSEAFSHYDAGTSVAFVIGGTTSGDPIYSGSALISSLTLDNPQNDKSTFSVELQVTGEITEGAVT